MIHASIGKTGRVGITACTLHFVQPPTTEPSAVVQLGSVLSGRLQVVEFTYSTDMRKSGASRSDVC